MRDGFGNVTQRPIVVLSRSDELVGATKDSEQ
jgi:hypothetical protein